MKNILVFFLLVSTFVVKAQQDSIPNYDSLEKAFLSKRTGFGKPIGEKNNKPIGPDGGIITSSDGKMELKIPPGALGSSTDISIQAVTNMVHGGIGNGYDCEPSGLQFQKPVQIIFNYTDSESKENNPLLQNIDWQGKDGVWHDLEKIKLDTLNKTVSGDIYHFTQFALEIFFTIDVLEKIIHVNGQTGILAKCTQFPDSYNNLSSEQQWHKFVQEKIRWFANGKENGDNINGFFSGEFINSITPDYYAPAVILYNNPVEIIAEMNGPFTLKNGWVLSKVTAKAQIKIIDEFHYTFCGYSKIGHVLMIDSSSCNILLDGKSIKLTSTQNWPPWSDWPPRIGGCDYTYTNKDSWKGLVQIEGIATSNVTFGSIDDPFVKVSISLTPAIGNTPSADVKCNGKSLPPLRSMSLPAQPTLIEFDTEGRDINIRYGGFQGKNVLAHIINDEGFAIWVTRVKGWETTRR